VQVVILHIDREESEDFSGHESEDSDNRIDDAKDDQEETCVAVGSGSDESYEPGDNVDDVMHGIDLKYEQGAIDEESGDACKEQDDTEDLRDDFDERRHESGGEFPPSVSRCFALQGEMAIDALDSACGRLALRDECEVGHGIPLVGGHHAVEVPYVLSGKWGSSRECVRESAQGKEEVGQNTQ